MTEAVTQDQAQASAWAEKLQQLLAQYSTAADSFEVNVDSRFAAEMWRSIAAALRTGSC